MNRKITFYIIAAIGLLLHACTSSIQEGSDNSKSSKSLKWEFPLTRPHMGAMIGNGTQGILVWGQENQLNITISRAGFWDRRGGREFTSSTTFNELATLLEAKDEEAVKALFKPKTKEGLGPKRTYQIGGGRIEVKFPEGYTLVDGDLDLTLADFVVNVKSPEGKVYKVKIDQAVLNELGWVIIPDELLQKSEISLVPSFNNPAVKSKLEADGVEKPEEWKNESEYGFTQSLPKDEPLSMVMNKSMGKLIFATALGYDSKKEAQQLIYETDLSTKKNESDGWYRKYWASVPSISIPDPDIQEIYDYGLYKMAACHPPHGIPCSLQGAFMEDTRIPPWSNDYHFNINIQMIYWPVLAAGKFDHLTPLWDMVMSWYPKMNDAGKKFYGNDKAIIMPHAVNDKCSIVGSFWAGSIDQACAAWVAQLAWLHYRYSMNPRILKEIAYPLMEGSFEGYYAMTETNANGTMSLPISVSPEFKGTRMDAVGKDASFQLAAFRMTAMNLQKAAKVLGKKPNPKWQEVIDKLPEYAVFEGPSNFEYPEYEEERIALWEGMDLVESHRHHSHLAGIYPFMTFSPHDEKHQRIAWKSYSKWIREGRGKWTGWCVPWASIIHSRMNRVDAAITTLHYWKNNFNNRGRASLCEANYQGLTDNSPKIPREKRPIAQDWNDIPFMEENFETMQLDGGFGAIDAIHNIFIQQRGEKVAVLPQIPDDWRTFEFNNIHVEGGFILSAKVKDWKIEKLIVKSRVGGEIKLVNTFKGKVTIDGKVFDGEDIGLEMERGQELVVISE